jgi:PAS domain S-box-containing protein
VSRKSSKGEDLKPPLDAAGSTNGRVESETGESESSARLRAIVDNAVDGIITIDEFGQILDSNPAAQRLFGYAAEELVGQNVRMLMPEPYRGEHDGYLRNYRETGHPKIIGIGREVAGRRKDGSIFPLELSVSKVQLGGRRLFTGIVRDVTERKRVEGERQKFVSLVENSSDFIAMASLTWELLYINKAGQDLIGLGPDLIMSTEVRDLWHEDTLPIVLENALPAQIAGGSFRFQGQIRHFVSGEPIDVDCNTFAILDPHDGRTLAIAFSLRDIRAQKRREQELRDGEAKMQAIHDSAVDGIITINERGIIEGLNPAAQRIFGYTTEEVIGQNIKMLMPEPYHGEHDQYLRNYRHTGQRKIIGIGREVVGRRKSGADFPIDLSVSEVLLGDRRLFTGIIRDITDRKEAEQRGRLLVAELSHRVKNTLAVVISVAQQTFHFGQDVAAAYRSFEGRLHALAQAHSRLADTNWAGASLRAVIEDELSPYQNADHSNIHLQGPEVLLGSKSAVSLGMAFHELVTNAAKYGALTTNGSIMVDWDFLRNEDKRLRVRWVEQGGPEVMPPTRSGFGRLLLERGLAHELRGKVQLGFAPSGLECTIEFQLDPLSPETDGISDVSQGT